MNELNFIVAGVLGVLFHCLLKLRSLQQDSRVANIPFNGIRDYWKKDAVSISLSFLSVAIWWLVFGEVGKKYKGLQEFKITSFALMGMVGSYLIQLIMSRAKKKIRTIVDEKTNELDELKK